MLTRIVKPSDFDDLYALIQRIYEGSPFMSQDFLERYPNRRFLEREANQSLCLVAEGQGALTGYLLLTPNPASKLRHTAELNMGVAPDAQGKGVGRMLLESAFAALADEGRTEIVYLHVRADNSGALSLYEKSGFERLCILSRDTKIGERYFDGVLMRKFINRIR